MSFLDLAKQRFSCRDYAPKEVEREKIDRIIEAGMVAPTATNAQPVKVWLFSKDEAKKVREVASIRFETPYLFVVGALPSTSWVREFDGYNYADVDASIVATHMMLQIEEEGLGTVWVGHFDAPALKKEFPNMEPYDLIAAFPVGYKADSAEPNPRHFESKSKEEFVEEH